ncbi:dienelactone hydrolase family protein [Nocardioides sp. Leaf374]|uniref:dienelactone hydrolase family protein n=1 Tax=Nocardioides sp. Leaf374 TaxID=2876560 RepID=UPI001E2C8B02|nr:dienelactone hydrolase family protein [Nocardioides sp. Leaf374]
MTHVVLFHHALGQTPGFHAFADRLRAAGHEVTAPDLYAGATFTDLDEGVAHARTTGFDVVRQRGLDAAADLPDDVVWAGMSLGLMPAQTLAQTRPGARGALLLHGSVPPEALGSPWPSGLPAQVHVMEHDDWGDIDDCRALAAAQDEVELFLYPGAGHLFTDASSVDHDPAASDLLLERVLAFLRRVG